MLSRFDTSSAHHQRQSEDLTPPAMFQPLSTAARHMDISDAACCDNQSEGPFHRVAGDPDYDCDQHAAALAAATGSFQPSALQVAWTNSDINQWETSSRPLADMFSPPVADAHAESLSDLDMMATDAFPLRLVDADGGPIRSLRHSSSNRRFLSSPDLPSYRVQALYNQSQGLDPGGSGGTGTALSSLTSTPMSMMDSPASASAYASNAGQHDAYHFGQLMQAANSQVSGGHSSSSGNPMGSERLRPAGRRSSISPVHQAYKSKQRKRNKCTPLQKEMLESFFARNRNPIGEIRERLAKDLDMPERSVQIWFQNKRAKVKAADMGLAPNPSRLLSRSSRAHSAGEMQNRSSRSGRSSQEPTIIQFPASALTIGSWRRISPLSCYFSKRLQMLTWYIRNNSIGFKLDLPSTYIRSIHLEGPRNPTPCEEAEGLREPVGDLVVQVSRPPTFFMEVFKSAGEVHSRNNSGDSHSHAWRQCADFTEGRQATSEEVHYVSGPYWDMRTQILEVKHTGGDVANLIDIEGIEEEEDDEDLVDHDGNDSDFFTTSEPPNFAPHTDQHNVPVPPYGSLPFEQSSPYLTAQVHPSQSMMHHGSALQQQQQHGSHMQQPQQGMHSSPLQQSWHGVMPMSGEHQQNSNVGAPSHHSQQAAISLHPNRSFSMTTPQRSFSYSDASSNGGASSNQFAMYNYQSYPTTSSCMSPRASSTSRTFASSPLGVVHPHHQHGQQQQQQQQHQGGSYLSHSAPAYDLNANMHLHDENRVNMTSMRMDATGGAAGGGNADMYAMPPANYETKFESLPVAHLSPLPLPPISGGSQQVHAQHQQQGGPASTAVVASAAVAQENAAAQLTNGWGSSYDAVTHIDPIIRAANTSSGDEDGGGGDDGGAEAGDDCGARDSSMEEMSKEEMHASSDMVGAAEDQHPASDATLRVENLSTTSETKQQQHVPETDAEEMHAPMEGTCEQVIKSEMA